MADALREARLKEHFGPSVDSPELLAACLSLCRSFNMDPETLFYAWESFTYNSTMAVKQLSEDRIPIFRDHLQREAKKVQNDISKKRTATSSTQTPIRKAGSIGGMGASRSAYGSRLQAGTVRTPQSALRDSTVKQEMEDVKLGSLSSALAADQATVTPALSTIRNRVVRAPNTAEYSYRYMFEKPTDRARVLDERIDQFGMHVRDFYGLEDEMTDPSAQTEEDVIIVGRICNSSEEKMTESSLLFEPSRKDGGGRRIALGFAPNLRFHPQPSGGPAKSTRPGIGLFPGAIAAFKGMRKEGLEGPFFMINEILPVPPLKGSSRTAVKGVERSYVTMIATGPFTFDTDLDYKPFHSVLDVARRTKPQALVLLGPFVDSNHPMIREGKIDRTTDEIFINKMGIPLREFLRDQPDISVALMPHVRDVISNWNVYPQSAEFTHPKFRMWNPPAPTPPPTFLSNPGIFSIHGVTFGATSVDILLHLRKEEVFKTVAGGSQTDPMAGLCRHLLDQRSFYPIFPTHADFSHDVNLDITHSHLLSFVDAIPDIIIVPSKLKEFSKVVDGTLFINPSTSSKSKAMGMVATLTVDAMRQGSDRFSVDLIRL